MPSVVLVSPELRLAVDHRLVGLVAGVAERQHLGDVDAVLVGQAALAVEPALAVGSGGELDADALEVGELGDAVVLGVLLGDDERVGVGRRGQVEQGDAGLVEQGLAVGRELLAVAGLEGRSVVAVFAAVEEVDDAADVLRHDVDVVGERRPCRRHGSRPA